MIKYAYLFGDEYTKKRVMGGLTREEMDAGMYKGAITIATEVTETTVEKEVKFRVAFCNPKDRFNKEFAKSLVDNPERAHGKVKVRLDANYHETMAAVLGYLTSHPKAKEKGLVPRYSSWHEPLLATCLFESVCECLNRAEAKHHK